MQRIFGPPLSPMPMQPHVPFQSGFMPPASNMFMPQPFSPAQTASFGTRGGGGLLSRLFGGGAARAASGAGSIDFGTLLTNTQRVLNLTQQAVPMIRQYGPIVRNLPTIWRIMREPDAIAELAEEVSVANEDRDQDKQAELPPAKKTSIDGLPLPKLYV